MAEPASNDRENPRPSGGATELAAQPSPDLSIVQAVLAGDRRATEELVARLACLGSILGVRNRRLGRPLSREELRDLAQDAAAVVWSKLQTFTGASSLETWLYGIAVLEFSNVVRRKFRRDARTVDGPLDAPDIEETSVERVSPVDFEHVLRALQGLETQVAAVIRLKHFEHLTFEEIAVRVGISPNTAKTQYYRGIERLRDRLRPLFIEESA